MEPKNAPLGKGKKHRPTKPTNLSGFHGITFGVCITLYNLDFSHGQNTVFWSDHRPAGLAFIGLGGFYRSGPRWSEGRWATGWLGNGWWLAWGCTGKNARPSWRCHVHVSNFVRASLYVLFVSKITVLYFYFVLVLFLPCLDDHFWVDDTILIIANGRCWSIDSSRLTRTSHHHSERCTERINPFS